MSHRIQILECSVTDFVVECDEIDDDETMELVKYLIEKGADILYVRRVSNEGFESNCCVKALLHRSLAFTELSN